jgi:hypothetical protein
MTFDPKEHLINLPRKVKNKVTGNWETTHDDYLEVKFRLVWFREKYPHGTIETEEICVDLDRGYARYKARVADGEGGIATGHGSETKADFADYCERAETRALGRALAAMGIGTQFVGAELDELPHVADAPVIPRDAPDAAHETPGMSPPLPVEEDGTAGAPTLPATNGHSTAPEPDASLAHPTESHLSALRSLALITCHEDVEAFETRVRRTAGLPAHASLAPKLLTRTLSMSTFMEVYGWYVNLEKQLAKAKGKEASGGTAPTTQPAVQPAPAPTEEGPTAVPSPAASSSAAPDPTDATERDRVRLRAEVAQWDLRVPPEEVEHVIQHNPYSKARALLWKCRRQETAAD